MNSGFRNHETIKSKTQRITVKKKFQSKLADSLGELSGKVACLFLFSLSNEFLGGFSSRKSFLLRTIITKFGQLTAILQNFAMQLACKH